MPTRLLKRIGHFASIGLLLGAFFYAPIASAQTPSGGVSRNTWINITLATCFPNNTQGLITPQVMRNCMTIFANSVLFSQSALSDLPGGPRATIADANFTATASNTWISYTSLTASRTVTLPASSSAGNSQSIFIGDESGNASLSTPIIVVTQGGDTFNGSLTSFQITSPYSYVEFRNNGSGLWVIHP
jgi:hypothetical protein